MGLCVLKELIIQCTVTGNDAAIYICQKVQEAGLIPEVAAPPQVCPEHVCRAFNKEALLCFTDRQSLGYVKSLRHAKVEGSPLKPEGEAELFLQFFIKLSLEAIVCKKQRISPVLLSKTNYKVSY